MGVRLHLSHCGESAGFRKQELKSLFVFWKDEGAAGFRNLRYKELNGLYPSQNFTWFIRSRKIERAGHLASTGWAVNIDIIVVGKPEKVTSWDIQARMGL